MSFQIPFRWFVALATLLLSVDDIRADIVYRLDDHAALSSSTGGFGLAGSITTDGSTGMLTTASFIKGWSMTVRTPSSIDGVSSEVFTPANSTLSLSLGVSDGLIVTTESIIFSRTNAAELSGVLAWTSTSGDTSLTFRTWRGGGLTISDPSEEYNPIIGVVAQGAGGAAIASGGMIVPEPHVIVLFGVVVSALTVMRKRRA
jgi:hypothetical protein